MFGVWLSLPSRESWLRDATMSNPNPSRSMIYADNGRRLISLVSTMLNVEPRPGSLCKTAVGLHFAGFDLRYIEDTINEAQLIGGICQDPFDVINVLTSEIS